MTFHSPGDELAWKDPCKVCFVLLLKLSSTLPFSSGQFGYLMHEYQQNFIFSSGFMGQNTCLCPDLLYSKTFTSMLHESDHRQNQAQRVNDAAGKKTQTKKNLNKKT